MYLTLLYLIQIYVSKNCELSLLAILGVSRVSKKKKFFLVSFDNRHFITNFY